MTTLSGASFEGGMRAALQVRIQELTLGGSMRGGSNEFRVQHGENRDLRHEREGAAAGAFERTLSCGGYGALADVDPDVFATNFDREASDGDGGIHCGFAGGDVVLPAVPGAGDRDGGKCCEWRRRFRRRWRSPRCCRRPEIRGRYPRGFHLFAPHAETPFLEASCLLQWLKPL
jgi:hypothetical protein